MRLISPKIPTSLPRRSAFFVCHSVSLEGDLPELLPLVQEPASARPRRLAHDLFFALDSQSSPEDAVETLMAFFTDMNDYSLIADVFDYAANVRPENIHDLVSSSPVFSMLIDFVWIHGPLGVSIFRCGFLLLVEAIALICPESVSAISTSFLPVAWDFLATDDYETQHSASRLLRVLFAVELPFEISQGDILDQFIDSFSQWVLSLGGNAEVPNDTIGNFFDTLHLMCDQYPASCEALRTLDVAGFFDGFSGCDYSPDLLAPLLECKKLLAAQFPDHTHFTTDDFFGICGLRDPNLTLAFAIVGYVIAGSIPLPDDYQQEIGAIYKVVLEALSEGSFEVKLAAASLLRDMLDFCASPEDIYKEIAPLLHDLMEDVDDFSCALPVLGLFSWFFERPPMPVDEGFNRWILSAFAELELDVEFVNAMDDDGNGWWKPVLDAKYCAAILHVIQDVMLTNAE
jgi:hypothetical protein